MSRRTDEPKEVLNISAGNQPITEEPKTLKPEDRRTGDFKQDFWSAFRVSSYFASSCIDWVLIGISAHACSGYDR